MYPNHNWNVNFYFNPGPGPFILLRPCHPPSHFINYKTIRCKKTTYILDVVNLFKIAIKSAHYNPLDQQEDSLISYAEPGGWYKNEHKDL